MFRPTNTLLVVIDVQGRLAHIVHDSERLLRNVGILIQGMNVLNVPIVVTEQYPKGLGPTEEHLRTLLGDTKVIVKDTFSCCGEFSFELRLDELHRTNIVVCGIETHVCVFQTVRDLCGMGYTVHVVTDAVSSRTPENRDLGLRRMEQFGAKLTSTEMVLFELLGTSGTEEFKAISKLVK
jgi:nicotinamidase-related amidase